jgi:hypothetical protein
MAIHAEAFAGGAEQRQKHDGEGVQKKKPRAGSGCLNSAPRKLSGFLPGYADCGALRF